MADSTPLLFQTESKPPPPSLDEVIEHCISDLGFSQIIQAIIVSFAWAFDAQQTFISIFTEAENTNKSMYSSVISDFNLEYSNSFIKGLPSSSFFMGCLTGGIILATLADSRLGRKNMLLLSCMIMSFASLFTVFSPNIWIYSFLKFINGFGRATIGTCALVLSTELVGKRWRGQIGVIGFFCFTLGFLSLPGIAYINRESSWRSLYLWTSIPTVLYCILVHLFVRESPRWLFIRGRKDEAMSILTSIAPDIMKQNEYLTSHLSDMKFEQESENVEIYSAIKILLQKRWAFRRLSIVMVIGFGNGFVYYGMPLGLGALNFNLYLSVLFNALSELPASLIPFFLIDKLSRKCSLLVFSTLSGICSILCVFLGNVSSMLQIGLEMVSFFCACTGYNILLIYSLELFPTSVRNSAISMARQALVFGGAVSPLVVAAGTKSGFLLSYGVFGLVIGICGVFVICLPETRGGTICDTMEEEENKERLFSCNREQDV